MLALALVGCGSDEPCEAYFANEKPTPIDAPASFTVRNDSAAPIFLAMHSEGGSAVGFRRNAVRVVPSGADSPLITAPNACAFACELYDNAQCGNQCSDDGHPPWPVILQPGETFTGGWSGLYFGQVRLPDQCLPSACSTGLECGRWLEAEAGDFTFAVTVATAWGCIDEECLCTENSSGWCQVDSFNAQAGPVDPTTLSAEVALPGGSVEFVWP